MGRLQFVDDEHCSGFTGKEKLTEKKKFVDNPINLRYSQKVRLTRLEYVKGSPQHSDKFEDARHSRVPDPKRPAQAVTDVDL